MNLKKSITLIISLFIILTLLNIFQETYTGKITSSYNAKKIKGSMTITPKIALQDETITINIKGPYLQKQEKYGKMANKVYFYRKGLRRGETKICLDSRCESNFTKEFTIPPKRYARSKWQEGIYIARIYDYLNKEYIETTLIVTNKSDPRIGCKDINDNGNDIYHRSETISHYSGKETTKKDVCLTDKKIVLEYYCCKNTDPNYKKPLGMCEIYTKCLDKCYKGTCFS